MPGKEIGSKSWAITFRPKHGVTDKLEKDFIKCLKRREYHAMAIEGEDECRHIHAQIWTHNESRKSALKAALAKILEHNNEEMCELTEDEMENQKRWGIFIRKPWNSNWIEEYCQKDGDLTLDNRPMDVEWDLFEQSCYPTKEEQAKIMRKAHTADHYFNRLLELWEEDCAGVEATHENVARQFTKWMFEDKKLRVEIDKRKRIQKCQALYLYINNVNAPDVFLSAEDSNRIRNNRRTVLEETLLGGSGAGEDQDQSPAKRKYDEMSDECSTYSEEARENFFLN